MAAEHKDRRRLRKLNAKHRDSLFSYLDHSLIVAENNASLSMLHPPVTCHKGMGGFRAIQSNDGYVPARSFVRRSGRQRAHASDAIHNSIVACAAFVHRRAKGIKFHFTSLPFDSRRIFDVAVASTALVATFPVLFFACVSIALTMHRKVFFLQQRYGKGGRSFTLIKLRSLKDINGQDVSGHGPQRLTPIARIIRRFGVDELPQFINILKGDMSIFGPRPFDIEPNVSGWNTRYAIKPGLIGLASVREKVSGIQSTLEKVAADDLEYIRRRTWKIDSWLLIMAMACIITGRIDPQEQRVSSNRVYNTLNRLALSTID